MEEENENIPKQWGTDFKCTYMNNLHQNTLTGIGITPRQDIKYCNFVTLVAWPERC